MPPFKVRLGLLIRKNREFRQLTIAQAVEATGGVISSSSWHEYERGEGEPRLGAMLAISMALGVPISEFIPGDIRKSVDHNSKRAPIEPQRIYALLGRKKNDN